MRICVDGPAIGEFDLQPAVMHWLNYGSRPKKKVAQIEPAEDQEESVNEEAEDEEAEDVVNQEIVKIVYYYYYNPSLYRLKTCSALNKSS